ncbi:MAG: lipoyl(octanoyl) transferase LipB [Pseudomonadota bacterium]|nr:lipoyl(octanoyl) transferase LipB [Pseudomonadota bacterium]
MILVRSLGREPYEPLWRRMQSFTDMRDKSTADEIWFTEHPPIFTLGLNASREHLLNTGDIPIIQVDRGGQVTYHGPGQLMIYPLIDLKRAGIGVRTLVTALEQSVVDLVGQHGVDAEARCGAPGVYVNSRKIASIGLRIRHGASFHGMALNVDVDGEPFSRINPCGFNNLEVTNLRTVGIQEDRETIQATIERNFLHHLGLQGETIVSAD